MSLFVQKIRKKYARYGIYFGTVDRDRDRVFDMVLDKDEDPDSRGKARRRD